MWLWLWLRQLVELVSNGKGRHKSWLQQLEPESSEILRVELVTSCPFNNNSPHIDHWMKASMGINNWIFDLKCSGYLLKHETPESRINIRIQSVFCNWVYLLIFSAGSLVLNNILVILFICSVFCLLLLLLLLLLLRIKLLTMSII
jgi:hypothetical protein